MSFGTYTVDFDVGDPRGRDIQRLTARMVPKFDIVAGVNTFESSREATMAVIYIFTLPLPRGQYSKNVRIVNSENESNRSGGTITVNKGDKVYITSAVRSLTTKLMVWVEPAAVEAQSKYNIQWILRKQRYSARLFRSAGINVFDCTCFSDLSMGDDRKW